MMNIPFDMLALATILYEMLTLQHLFTTDRTLK